MEPPRDTALSLSVFIPFFNEEKNIGRAVEDVVDVLEKHRRIFEFEVIVVNDGSTDATKNIGEYLARMYPQVKIVSHEMNRGYGGAVITGIKNSSLDYVFYMDGDNQFDIRDINRLLEHVPAYDAVIGYRKDRQDSLQRKINAELWNGLMRLVFRLKIKDIDCAFKIFRREAIASLPLVSTGAMISTELLVRLRQKGVVIKQVPVMHLPRVEGKPTGAGLSVILRAFRELLSLYQK